MDPSKTSGGISKSLLTPIRRLGLTKRRRQTGASPLSLTPQSSPVTTPSPLVEKNILKPEFIGTPARKLGIQRSQKTKGFIPLVSKALLYDEEGSKKSNIVNTDCNDSIDEEMEMQRDLISTDNEIETELINNNKRTEPLETENLTERTEVAVLNRKRSKEKSTTKIKESPQNNLSNEQNENNLNLTRQTTHKTVEIDNLNQTKSDERQSKQNVALVNKTNSKERQSKPNVAAVNKTKSKERTPKSLQKRKSGELNLKRKCIVVIDQHILNYNKDKSPKESTAFKRNETENRLENCKSIVDSSEEDDVPLKEISEQLNINKIDEETPHKIIIKDKESDENSDTEFCENSLKRSRQTQNKEKIKVAKLDNKKMSNSSTEVKPKRTASKDKISNKIMLNASDSEDDDFNSKKTILIKKSYPKPLHKAKSTGSITQKDIDDIKVRIKMKKNALLIKSGGHNIEELMELIKKWRKGCQEALMELLDLMKRKVPEKQNMNTTELLRMLNIPTDLVDYDGEDDCFISPQ